MFQESGTSFMDKMSNLSDQPLLSAATHPDSSPTPPHLSQKLVSLSHTSIHKCVYLMQHLLEIAQNNAKHVNSRIKAVRMMQELVLKGDPAFQQLLQKEEHKLKPVANFLDQRAPLDSSRLRESVSELLEVLFDEISRPNILSPPPTYHAPSQSCAPTQSYGQSKYEGFGNPYFANNRGNVSSGSGMLDQVSGKVSEIMNRVPPPDPNRFVSKPDRTTDWGPQTEGTEYAQNHILYAGLRDGKISRGFHTDPRLPNSSPHMPGVAGGEWDSREVSRENGLGEERGDGHLERQLVEEFTAVGGVRSKPTKLQVDQLIARSRSLDSSLLVLHAISHLEAGASGSKLKCLFLLEGLYNSSPTQFAPLITAHTEILHTIAESEDSQTLRNKSREFISLLGIPTPVDVPIVPIQPPELIETSTQHEVSEDSTQGSLFNGMVTSQQESNIPETQPLISGLEDLALPELSPTPHSSSDMIDLGPSQPLFSFDPLLDTTPDPPAKYVPPAPQYTPSQVYVPLAPQYTPSQVSAPPQMTLQAAERTDSFGFISDHIRDLKDFKD